MGFFTDLFGNNASGKDEVTHAWFDSEEELDQLIERSKSKPVAIFKHSTRCNISDMAKHRIERNWDFPQDELEIHFLDLITFRNVSNKIAAMLQVEHASPQVILIKDGQAVYHTSHNDISVSGLREALNGNA